MEILVVAAEAADLVAHAMAATVAAAAEEASIQPLSFMQEVSTQKESMMVNLI